ncbi:MAG TPA: hypothetical protein VFV34_03885 [Blastocatellia bacterium]|nr:hypothetical protein [Blastocatellia bacterium]
MKTSAIQFLLILVFLAAAPSSFGQKGCALNLVGTWSTGNSPSPVLYRFGEDATVTALSQSGSQSELREIASANYVLDDPKAPKLILIKAAKEGSEFPLGTTAIDITGYDDTSFTCKINGYGEGRWTRVDTNRYFMVLAGRRGIFYDSSGPTFPMMIKTDGRQTQIDAVGIYGTGGYWSFGPVPAETYNYFMKEPPRSDSEVMLRLEITGVQYQRALNIVRTWARRVREGDLLYPDLPMDNILLVKQVTESLNQCGERVKLYKLDWSLEDRISSSSPRDDNPISRTPFMYFQELRRLNESIHVGDEKFRDVFKSTRGPQGP